jgi:hypothetical protein
MSLDEDLSRLLDGDLPEPEAAALRGRIASDPEVARAWEAMASLPDALASLPVVPDDASPPGVPDALLVSALPSPSSLQRAGWRRALPWAVAVAALFFAFLRGTTPVGPERIQLIAGESVLDGDLHLLAGDRAIDLDGRARVFVEPPDGVVRGAEQNASLEDPMDTRTLLGALAGAVVTITVYEGSAVVLADDGTPVTVEAGENRVFAPGDAPTRSARTDAPAPGTPERAKELLDRLDALNAELSETRKALETEKFAGALVRGQLKAEQGDPSTWEDADVPDAMRPERFEAELRAALEGAPDVAIDRVDCSEFPCIAVLEYTGPSTAEDGDWNQAVGKQVSDWTRDVLGEGTSMSMNSSRFRTDDADARYVLFGAHASGDDNVSDRTDWRMGQLVDVLGDELKE